MVTPVAAVIRRRRSGRSWGQGVGEGQGPDPCPPPPPTPLRVGGGAREPCSLPSPQDHLILSFRPPDPQTVRQAMEDFKAPFLADFLGGEELLPAEGGDGFMGFDAAEAAFL